MVEYREFSDFYLTEKQFFAKHDFDFLDYYGVVNEEVVDRVNKESKNRDGVLSSKVSDGYGYFEVV